MIKTIFTGVRGLLTQLHCKFNLPPRSPNISTQSTIMLPFTINHLHDNIGSRRYPKQVGRGPGSGKGKFAARGMKGHKARSGGGVSVRFEGGQTPIHRRLPKYNKLTIKKKCEFLSYINLGILEYYIKRGVINASQKITIKTLHDAQIVKDIRYGVKLLSKGYNDFSTKVNIEVTDASKSAIERVQSLGGSIQLVYRSPIKLRQHLFPKKFKQPVQQSIPQDYILRRIHHIQKDRNIKVQYKKPKWKIQQQQSNFVEPKSDFIYPVPRVPNSGKIRKRKPKIFKTISYKL